VVREGLSSAMPQTTTYILIDYENVHPTEIGTLFDGPFKIKLFVGANQTKIPLTLAKSMQSLGENAEYIQLTANGSNALDFHIAYYIGRISAVEPKASFLIVSNDAGFDPLIIHLKANGIIIRRSPCLSNSLPQCEPGSEAHSEFEFEIEGAMAHLASLNGSKPRSKKTLLNVLRGLFKQELKENEIAEVLRVLCIRGIVKPVGAKIEYAIPFEEDEVPF